MDGTQMLLPMGDRTVLIWSHHGAQWSECAKIAQQWGKSNEVKSLGNRSISDNQFLVNIYQYSIFFKITNLVRNLFRGHGFFV